MDESEQSDEDISEEERQRKRIEKEFFSGSLGNDGDKADEPIPESVPDPVIENPALEEQIPSSASGNEILGNNTPQKTLPLKQILKGHSEEQPSMLKKIVSIVIAIFNLLIIVALVILIRIYVVSPFSVEGSSMEENFTDGDLILVDKLTYAIRDPHRGDVIVFHPPQPFTNQSGLLCEVKKIVWPVIGLDRKAACITRVYFVKRVIGLPGDTVRIENGKVFVTPKDGDPTLVREDFLSEKNRNRTCFDNINCSSEQDIRGMEVEVPEGAVYVLGDNRTGSSDSREWRIHGKSTPFIPFDDISGKVRVIFWPFADMSVVPNLDPLETPKDVKVK